MNLGRLDHGSDVELDTLPEASSGTGIDDASAGGGISTSRQQGVSPSMLNVSIAQLNAPFQSLKQQCQPTDNARLQ